MPYSLGYGQSAGGTFFIELPFPQLYKGSFCQIDKNKTTAKTTQWSRIADIQPIYLYSLQYWAIVTFI